MVLFTTGNDVQQNNLLQAFTTYAETKSFQEFILLTSHAAARSIYFLWLHCGLFVIWPGVLLAIIKLIKRSPRTKEPQHYFIIPQLKNFLSEKNVMVQILFSPRLLAKSGRYCLQVMMNP